MSTLETVLEGNAAILFEIAAVLKREAGRRAVNYPSLSKEELMKYIDSLSVIQVDLTKALHITDVKATHTPEQLWSWVPKNNCDIFVLTDAKGQSKVECVGLIGSGGTPWFAVSYNAELDKGRMLGYRHIADAKGTEYTVRTLAEVIDAVKVNPSPKKVMKAESKQLQPSTLPKQGSVYTLSSLADSNLEKVYINSVCDPGLNAATFCSTITYQDDIWVPTLTAYTREGKSKSLVWDPETALWQGDGRGNLLQGGAKEYYAIN